MRAVTPPAYARAGGALGHSWPCSPNLPAKNRQGGAFLAGYVRAMHAIHPPRLAHRPHRPRLPDARPRRHRYGPSKSALNAVTVAFAQELADTNIKVNAACPGHTATDLNGHSGPRTAVEAAREPVRLALLGDDGPTGTFSNDAGTIAW